MAGSAPLAPMSFHLDVENVKFILQRAQKIARQEKNRRNEEKRKTHGAETKTCEKTKKHEQKIRKQKHVLPNANLAFALYVLPSADLAFVSPLALPLNHFLCTKTSGSMVATQRFQVLCIILEELILKLYDENTEVSYLGIAFRKIPRLW